MYPVLLHPDLYRSLRDSAPAGRARVWKTLTRLRDGRWGGGTRVKRLRGIGRPVYEARTDSGDRLLFTMVRSAPSGMGDMPGRLLSYLQVWDWVEHDDAVRTARRNRAPEAEFLELEALEEFEIQEPPPFPAARLDEIPADPAEAGGGAGEVDPLLRFLLPPDGFEPVLPEDADDLRGGVRWFRLAPAALASEAEFQRLLDAGGEDLELKLTREQYEVLRAPGPPGPILLAGSAGSGKTTIAVHRLAQAALSAPANPGRALYLSYSPALVEHARGLYGDLMRARPDARTDFQPDFFTFGDLYRALVPRDFREHQARPMSERLFREWFRKAGRSLDPGLVWEELRSILKGACLSPSQPMLDEAAYYELGRKRAPLFVDERPEIYRIAQRYQEWLAEEGRSDRIDLCRRALQELKSHREGRRKTRWSYDTVVCDEVQDLTELEVSFVLSLSAREDLGGVLLTGDTQQIVNPSGFRWAEARRLAGKHTRKRTAPEVTRLRRNLRSARPVVELANALLLLRREVFGRTEGDEPEEAAIAGPVPLEVPGEEDAVLAALADFGPRAAVLTLDDAEAERLRRKLGTTRVFHVREAKGLEFDAVLLWKPLEPDRDLVERFGRAPGQIDSRLTREPRFEHLLRHLYVAVTRARRHLAVYEGPQPHPFWSDARLRGRIEREAVESLAHLFRPTASPADWAREGDYFFERGRFRQAAECYRRASLPEREAEALAHAEEALEDWAGALERWNRLGMAERQAPLLERLGRLSEAARLYREAGQEDAARRCELRLLEQRGAWKEAAAGWEESGGVAGWAEAARCWARAGEERRALQASAHAAEESGDLAAAAGMWSSVGDYAAAARCHRASGDTAGWRLARARADEAAGRWARAAASYRRAGMTDAAERCRARAEESAGRLEQAAHTWENLGEVERALDLYARGDRWLDVARLEAPCREKERRLLGKVQELLETGAWQEASPLARRRLEALRPYLPEVPWFVASEEQRLVWQEFCLLSDLENRCRALQAEAEGAWSRAARCWRIAGDHGRAAAAWTRRIEAMPDPLRRARAWIAVGDPERARQALAEAGPAAQEKGALLLKALRAGSKTNSRRGA